MRWSRLLAASAALAAGLLSGCGAGQVTQTENQAPPISGINVDSEDGLIQLRDLAIGYSGPEGYPKGATAPLRVHIVNRNNNPVRLVGVISNAGAVVLSGPSAAPPAPSVPPSPASPSGSPSVRPSGSPAPSGSTSPSASESSAPPASPAPAGNPRIEITIPADGFVVLRPGSPRYLQVTSLAEAIKPGQTIQLTFRFDNGVTITTPVPMTVPTSPLPRSPLEMEEGH